MLPVLVNDTGMYRPRNEMNFWIGVNARVVVARFARRRHFWGIWAAVSVGSQCVVAR